MTNFFNFSYTLPMSMNNWFMPNLVFNNYFGMFQMPMFNIFDNFMNRFNFNYNPFSTSIYPTFYDNYTNDTYISNETPNKVSDNYNIDTFTKRSDIDYSKDELKLDGYNAFKGERLAKIALNNSVGWTGFCATYVKRAIQAANLGSYEYGHAYQMPNILSDNSNFKEISPEGVDVSKLPAGCVLVYGKDVEGYSKKYGHTEITTGDGRAVSDGITKHLYKKPSNIFVPV